ncbi:sigma-70 family RNA polymerase sigma factor [Allorhodopirellula heiligendammensis]|uniref:RNA polymerase sigma factor CnrH n=1 Tax=Allorhodopirellula heiligendammensis TaxID=2714739 RepID=A0A5C6BW21_9BACT|nr:sigma-70 family RNA polymerase sigma factor [Allorhodopirellula heiligendammensis]TWU16178.1 RNA polymerase sigma factor CnrH [Allorhodopirellula heiligendammensis]
MGMHVDETTRQATRQWALAQPAVSAFITSVVRDFRDRDDVLQDVAVAVIESFNSYDPDYPFVAWAIGVARNQVRLYLRGRRRDRLVFDDETVAALAMAVTEVMPEATPQMDYLHDCIDLVEGRASLLLELRYRNDLKPAAIADQVGMTANSVAKALQRVREHLKNCIDQKHAEAGIP